jgi:hypothetical protein
MAVAAIASTNLAESALQRCRCSWPTLPYDRGHGPDRRLHATGLEPRRRVCARIAAGLFENRSGSFALSEDASLRARRVFGAVPPAAATARHERPQGQQETRESRPESMVIQSPWRRRSWTSAQVHLSAEVLSLLELPAKNNSLSFPALPGDVERPSAAVAHATVAARPPARAVPMSEAPERFRRL